MVNQRRATVGNTYRCIKVGNSKEGVHEGLYTLIMVTNHELSNIKDQRAKPITEQVASMVEVVKHVSSTKRSESDIRFF